MRLFTTLCYNFAVSAVFDSRRLHGQNGSQVFVTWELFCFNEFTVTRTATRGPSKLPEFQYAPRSQLNAQLRHLVAPRGPRKRRDPYSSSPSPGRASHDCCAGDGARSPGESCRPAASPSAI